MSNKANDFVSADTVIQRLCEAIPAIQWHVSPDAVGFILTAMEFTARDNFSPFWRTLSPNYIGKLCGGLVYVDAQLQGRTIELRIRDGETLSAVTLE